MVPVTAKQPYGCNQTFPRFRRFFETTRSLNAHQAT